MPPIIPYADGYTDRSTDFGYQFEFTCRRCGNSYASTPQKSAAGTTDNFARAAGGMFGGMLGGSHNKMAEMAKKAFYDRALGAAVEEVRGKFAQCPDCREWVCRERDWNAEANRCSRCVPISRTAGAPTRQPDSAPSPVPPVSPGFGPLGQRPGGQTPPVTPGMSPLAQRLAELQGGSKQPKREKESLGGMFGGALGDMLSEADDPVAAIGGAIFGGLAAAGLNKVVEKAVESQAVQSLVGQLAEQINQATGGVVDLRPRHCGYCGTRVPTGKFCPNCGRPVADALVASMATRCRTCNADLPLGAAHCKICGASNRPRAVLQPLPTRTVSLTVTNWRDT